MIFFKILMGKKEGGGEMSELFNFLIARKQTTKFTSSKKFKEKMFKLYHIENSRLEGEQCRSRATSSGCMLFANSAIDKVDL